MADPHNVEFEAAKFLQKLIHESTDEPAKLATKLYVILQHMKASGKENTMPYQVISRAMETVINQHGLDIEALMSSRLPMSSGSHGGESSRPQPGCSQAVGVATDSKSEMIEHDTTRPDGFGSGRPPAGPSSMGNDPFQGSASQRSAKSFDHESPSSMDTRSTNSHSQDRREPPGWEQQGIQKDAKKPSIKRKRSDASGMETPDDITQQLDSQASMPDIRKERLTSKSEAGGTLLVDPESWKQGFFKGAPSFRDRAVPGHISPNVQVDLATRNLNSACSLDSAGISNIPPNADRLSQGGNPSNLTEVGALGSSTSRDTGKFPAVPNCATGMPFKEHHLKQLRAQCLVFLAFRNGLSPKRLHLEIALGNILVKEGSSGSVDGVQNELTKDKGKQHSTFESSSLSEVPLPGGNLANVKNDGISAVSAATVDVKADLVSKEAENAKLVEKPGSLTDPSCTDGEKKQLLPGNGMLEDDTESQETANSSALMTASWPPDTSGMRSPATLIHDEQLGGSSHAAYVGMNKQLKPDMMRWSRVPLHSSIHHDLGSSNDSAHMLLQRENNIQNQQRADGQLSTTWKSIQGADIGHHRARPANDSNMLLRNALHDGNGALETQTKSIPDGLKAVPIYDSSYMHKDSSALGPMDKFSEPEEEEKSTTENLTPSPKLTLSEKWIMAHQKRKLATQQEWVQKLQKADQRISTCFVELKETVSSSADISAKTRSVIELKKLQLLELQRCLRSNILSDFFKPIQTEMDRLKSIKKHRIGRRLKHVEKYEQKMKEERQKRIRERQKEFFSEVEVHKERLEDVFKFKRERCKGFNRYVKEFHKRKERIHREKIDRIQREKINLLKINDVEGYLRMVQDAKSDRVKQLLKETEKYLTKLGSKLKEAKAAARQVEMDENRIATIDESNDIFTEAEDENDQAKHYKESNEKYYLIAHSIKESIAEQPTGLRGGKLREYQMNGLRWLVSLYNNHLNGILADEMGLGKTVQVISLICYLMENKNDRGPFLVVVPSSVLPGWEQELSFWAPGINKIVYAGPPEERRRLFKECIIHQKFNVLLTTYEYLMNKHDRPKLSKLNWHYIIIDEGHRIKNASCKLNADLKLYHSSHRLLLTGTPLQNNLEELWALLNFLLPNIFNSSEDFSQWFNKPFESNGDASPDQALLSEEENLLIINRLHQVLRPFVLRRLKHKVENELPEKIERLVRCEASAYQKLLMKRVEENLGALGVSKARAVHNSVMELRNICNHPYLSQLHAEEVDNLMPKHFLPPIVRLCGKLEMLDRLLPKLKATNHRVLFFSTMTRLLDVMEEYLVWKQYRYLRLDGHTSGLERGALIEQFNRPDSPFFIFLLSIRAGGVGVNLQAADTVIIFDTDWNPQVDLQAQARAHRIGQKKDVLVLRLETVHTVEEQVRASAEHKLGVANQSITAGFFDNNTSAEDRREYLESLLREPKKEEAAPVLDDDSLNDILARSENEIDAFEEVDQKRREEEMATWKSLVAEKGAEASEETPPLPSRLVTEDDLKAFYEAMKIYEVADDGAASGSGMKRKGGSLGGYDTQQYGRGKRAREVRSYEEQWTEEEFEKICQAESPETPKPKDEKADISVASDSVQTSNKVELSLQPLPTPPPSLDLSPPIKKEITPTVKRGRGRPKRMQMDASRVSSTPIGAIKRETQVQKGIVSSTVNSCVPDLVKVKDGSEDNLQVDVVISPSSTAVSPSSSADPGVQSNTGSTSVANQLKRQGRKGQTMEKKIEGSSGNDIIRRRGRKTNRDLPPIATGSLVVNTKPNEQALKQVSSDVSVSTSILVGSGIVLAKGPGGAESKSLEAGTGRAVVELKDSELARKQTSFETPSIAAHPVIGTEKSKINSLSDSDKVSPQESAAVPADAAVQDPKQVESPLLGSSQVSAKKKGDPVSQDEDQAIGSRSSSKSGTKLNEVTPLAATPSSESVEHSPVGLRPGRRQNQKPQSGIEPVRRRGRKRGRIDSNDSAPLEAKDNNLNDSVKSTSGPYISAPSEPANLVTGSHLPAVPVIPLVPVSGFTLGSGLHVSLGSASGSSTPATLQSSPFISGTPAIPPETAKMPVALQVEGKDQRAEACEKAPRRRGRKKSAALPADNLSSQYLTPKLSDKQCGDIVDRKVITTRSRQSNISQASNIQEEAHLGITPTSLTSKGLEATQSTNLSSHAVASSSVLQPASMKADAGSKPQQSRRVNSKEEIALCRSPAEIPPVSCKGKTNVIVLALDFTGPALSYREADSKKGCSELQKDLARNVKQKVEVSELEVSRAAGVPVPNVDEELSAPPGFDTPRAGVSDSTVRKSSESYNGGKSKSCVAKSGSVVLALESTTHTIDPCSLVCQNLLEKEKSSGLCEVKDSGKQSDSSSMAIRCEPPSVSADTVTTGQPEEEISAPPGFDIPQRCITDKAVVSSKCDDDLVSDKIPDSAQKSKVEEHPQGYHDDDSESKAVNNLTDSNIVGCDLASAPTLKLMSSKGPDVGEVDAAVTPEASSVFISDAAEKSSLELKVDIQSQGPNDDTSEVKTDDAPAPSCVLCSDTTTVSILDIKEKEECHGGRDVNVEFVVGEALPVSHAPPSLHTETAITLKSTEKENYDVSDDGSAKVGAADASATLYTIESGNVQTASYVEYCNTEPVSSLELKENEECYGHGAGNAPTTLHILGSNSPPSASLESPEKEVSHENKDGTAGHNAVDAPPAFDSRTASTLESKKENVCLGPDSDDTQLEAGDTFTGRHVSDIAVSTRLELEEKEDGNGPHGGNVEPDTTDTLTATHVQLDSLATSTLETSHGVNVATSGQDASDAPIATCVVDPGTSVSILEEKEQDHDDVGSAEQDDTDAHTASCVIGTDSTAAATLRANEQEDYHGLDVGKAIQNPIAPPASFIVGTDSTATLTLEENALQQQYEGAEVQSAKLDATDDPTTSCTFETGNTSTTPEEKEGDEHQRLDVADAEQVLANALTASCGVGIGTSTASTVEEKEQEKSHGLDVTSAEQDPAYASFDPCVVGISITTTLIVDEKEQVKSHELDVGNAKQGGDVSTPSCPVITDTSSSATLAEKDEEEHNDFDNAEQDADNVCPASCAVDMDGSVAQTVEKQELDHQEMGVGNAELLSDNTPSACYVASSDATASTMKENNQEELDESDVNNARQAADDSLQASFVVSSDTIPASTVEQHVQDHLEQSTDIAPTNSFVSGIGTASAATLEENDLEEQHGLNVGGAKEDADNDFPALNVVGTTTPALTLDENGQGHQDSDVGVAEHGAKNGVIDSYVGSVNADAAILEEYSQEVKHDPDVGYAEQHADNAPSSFVGTDTTPASTTEEKDQEECHVLDLGDAEQYVDKDNAPSVSYVVGTHTTPTSTLVENEQDEYPEPDVGDGEKDAFNAPIGSCVVGFDTATASTVQENDQEEDCEPNVGNAEQHGDNAHPASCVGTDTTLESTLEENELEECHDSDVGFGELHIDDAPSVSRDVGIDANSTSTLVENDQDEHHESDVSAGEKDADNALTGSCVVGSDAATAATLQENDPEEHHEPDVGNAEQHADIAPSASCFGTDTTPASTSEENDREECHGIGELRADNASSASCVVGIDATPASTSVGNNQDDNHEPDVGDAKKDANSAPTGSSVVGSDTAATLQENDQEEHHEPDVGNAEQHGDNDPPASCVGADTTLGSTSEENDQEEYHDLDVSNAKQQTDNAPSASCVDGVDATSASTLVEKDQEEHHEPDVGDAKNDADNAPTGSGVVGFDTSTTTTLQENDPEPDIGNAEQHADNAPLAACDAGTDITPPSIMEQNDLEEHHEPDIIYAEHDADIVPAVSCIVGTVTATTETPEKYNQKGHHDSFVNTDTTASGDASKASCGVQVDTNVASFDAPTASTVCMNNSTGSGDVPAASCVPATDTATALTLQDKNQDSRSGLDVLTEQNVGDVHATSCVVTTDATAASGDASTASCCVSPDTITASGDAPTASFIGTDNIMESGDVPSASCVVATDSVTPLTLEDKDQVEGSGCADGKSEHVDHDPSVASGSND